MFQRERGESKTYSNIGNNDNGSSRMSRQTNEYSNTFDQNQKKYEDIYHRIDGPV